MLHPNMTRSLYDSARETYAALGVDTEAALATLIVSTIVIGYGTYLKAGPAAAGH